MAKIVVFDLANYSIGDFTAICNRGYMVYGSTATSGGGSTTITVSKDILQKGWLAPGRMVLVTDDMLPPWAGVIDMPVGLIAPAVVTIYNAPYLLGLRSPDATAKLTGTAAAIAKKMLEMANAQEEMYIRIGAEGGSSTYREEAIDGRTFWEQLNAMVTRSASEMVVRAEREISDGNRLYTYLDLFDRVGYDTDFLLHEGRGANVKVRSATIERPIWNRVIGINNANAAAERLSTVPKFNQASINAYRMRTKTQQFQTKIKSTLNSLTENYVNDYGRTVLKFDVSIMDVRDTFAHLAEGNGVILHAPNAVLPDGRKGWRGTARLMAMAFNEKERTIGATLEAYYDL